MSMSFRWNIDDRSGSQTRRQSTAAPASTSTVVALVAAAAMAGLTLACGPAVGGSEAGPAAGAEAGLVMAPEDAAAIASSPDEAAAGGGGAVSGGANAASDAADAGDTGDTGDTGGAVDGDSDGDGAAGSSAAGSSAAGAPAISSEGGFDGQFTELNWDELYELDLETGEPSPLLAGLDGQPVKIPGFMVPLDDSATSVSEFLLVPFAGACIHVPPPPPNQIVHVTMVDGTASEVYWWDPIWIYGDLQIENIEHAFGQASYRMSGLRTEVYTAQPAAP